MRGVDFYGGGGGSGWYICEIILHNFTDIRDMGKRERAEKREIDRVTFVGFRLWGRALLSYPDELRLKIHDAVLRYVMSGEMPEDERVLLSIFTYIKETLDEARRQSEECRRKLSEAGRRGAAKTNGIKGKKQEEGLKPAVDVTKDDRLEGLKLEDRDREPLSDAVTRVFRYYNDVLERLCVNYTRLRDYTEDMRRSVVNIIDRYTLEKIGACIRKYAESEKLRELRVRGENHFRWLFEDLDHFDEIMFDLRP